MRYNGFWWRVLKPLDRLFGKTDRACAPIVARWLGYATRRWRCENCGTLRAIVRRAPNSTTNIGARCGTSTTPLAHRDGGSARPISCTLGRIHVGDVCCRWS